MCLAEYQRLRFKVLIENPSLFFPTCRELKKENVPYFKYKKDKQPTGVKHEEAPRRYRQGIATGMDSSLPKSSF